MKKISKQYDLVVIGGGMAGVCAAISAARHGCRTALVHDRPVLGGNASSEIRVHICGADFVCDGLARRETGILEELRLANLARNPQNSACVWDLLLYEWVKREPLLDLYLNCPALEPVMAGATRIQAVRARQLAAEIEWEFCAPLFADCSGDSQIAALAGADFRQGREAAAEYGEDLAETAADRHTLGSSLLFVARDMGRPMPFVRPDWAHEYESDTDLANRSHKLYQHGYWWIEWGGQLDTITDNEKIRDELLKIMMGVWDHIKNHGDHGADNWALDWIGVLPGKRESRRLLGEHVLCQADVQAGRLFPDAVAYGGWPIDTHPINGFDDKTAPCRHVKVPLYSIPLRALYSRNIENLFFAGRNISATHIAFATIRVMSTTAVMGQAVGVAAACCARAGILPRQALARVAEIQQLLLADDCHIPGQCNADPLDQARAARVSGSGANAGAVIDGWARPAPDDEHCWESPIRDREPAVLELAWPAPVTIRRLRITFDSELEKRLIFSQDQSIYSWPNVLTAIPQRLARDFSIQVRRHGAWEDVRTVTGNLQRLYRLDFQTPPVADALRISVYGTHGAPVARIFEVRVY